MKASPVKQNPGANGNDVLNSTFEASEDMSGMDSMCERPLIGQQAHIIMLYQYLLSGISYRAFLLMHFLYRFWTYPNADSLGSEISRRASSTTSTIGISKKEWN